MDFFDKVKTSEDLGHLGIAVLVISLGKGWLESVCAELPEDDCDYILGEADNWVDDFKDIIDEICLS